MKMKWILAGLFFITVNAFAQQNERPNIIFFFVDDLGWQDISVPFWEKETEANKRFRTPNLEKMAGQGMKFTSAYANAVCTPTRVSFLTGMNVARHKVSNWTMHKNTPTDATDDPKLQAPDWNVNGVSATPGVERAVYATTLASLLKQQGYRTIHVGKAHWGAAGTPGAEPLNLGFDVNIGGTAAGQPGSFYGEKNYGNNPGSSNFRAVPNLGKYWGSDTYITEAITLEAIREMEESRIAGKPFFLNMSQYAVHLPFEPDPRFSAHYKDLPAGEAAYATMVEGFDKSLGDLMDYLEKNDLQNRTLIVFMSDNGGYTREPRMGPFDTQNSPLRNGKGSLFEGGIRVPLIVQWTGVVPAGTESRQIAHIHDFFPTLLEIAGLSKPHTIQVVDGKSLFPYFRDPARQKKNTTQTWHFPNKWTPDRPDIPDTYVSWTSAIRKGDWKLIYYYRDATMKLYNLAQDIGESRDLSTSRPGRAKHMVKRLRRELEKKGAQMPLDKMTGHPVPFPHFSK